MGRSRAFTLVELMIVVAIIQVLAAIAIPNFYTFQLRAKQAELYVNTAGIHDAGVAWFMDNDAWPVGALNFNPDSTPGKGLRDWRTSAPDFQGWNEIGYSPDGQVRGSYGLGVVSCYDLIVGAGGACLPDNFPCMAAGATNLDEDTEFGCVSVGQGQNATLDPDYTKF